MTRCRTRTIATLLILPTLVVLAGSYASRFASTQWTTATTPRTWSATVLSSGEIYIAHTGNLVTFTPSYSPYRNQYGVSGPQRLYCFGAIAVRDGEVVNGMQKMAVVVASVRIRVLLVLTVPIAVLGVWLLRGMPRALQGHCRRCGYDLRATPDHCPECGAILWKSIA